MKKSRLAVRVELVVEYDTPQALQLLLVEVKQHLRGVAFNSTGDTGSYNAKVTSVSKGQLLLEKK